MNAPFTNVSNYANLLGSLQAPTTTTSQVQYSPLTQAATLANTLQGTGVTGGLGTLLFGTPATEAVGTPGQPGYVPAKAATGLGGIGNLFGTLFNSNPSPSPDTATPTPTPTPPVDYTTVVPESNNPVIPVTDKTFETNPV
jgi:hypothetical protein